MLSSGVEGALQWCRSAALDSLSRLHTLVIERPFWSLSKLTPPMLVDLHALSMLPNLVSVELTCVAHLNGVDLAELLTLHDPPEMQLYAVHEWKSDEEEEHNH